MAVVTLLTALAGALLVAGAPAASAQDDPEFARLDFKISCASNQQTFQIGMVVTIPGGPPFRYEVCGPKGFYPVRTEALCDQHGQASGWIPSKGACVTSYWFGHVVERSSCLYPHVWLEDFQLGVGRAPANYCATPVLSNASLAPAPFRAVTPVCIEDAIVQQDGAAAALRVGDSFVSSDDGTSYLIVMGETACNFACYDGFDLNCDGKLGDYCPADIDFRTVAGVAGCNKAVATSS